MPEINKWVIPKNTDKPVEMVYEIKDDYQIPSFEDFMKDYQADEKISDSYADELGSYDDVGVDKGYGPCKICVKFPEPKWVDMEMTCPAVGCTAARKGSK